MYCTAYNERRAIMLISVLVSVCVGVRVFVRECTYVVYVCVTYSRDALTPCAPECARACVRAYVRVRADSNTNQIYLVALISIITAFENHLISYSHIYNFIERRWFESVKEGVGVFRGVVIRVWLLGAWLLGWPVSWLCFGLVSRIRAWLASRV